MESVLIGSLFHIKKTTKLQMLCCCSTMQTILPFYFNSENTMWTLKICLPEISQRIFGEQDEEYSIHLEFIEQLEKIFLKVGRWDLLLSEPKDRVATLIQSETYQCEV